MDIKQLQAHLEKLHLPAWDTLPDFGLYMDQLITCVERFFPAETTGVAITPAMINNYVKAGLIDRPQGKKYARASLAQLLMVCFLKQTASMEDMNRMLHQEIGTEQLYNSFRSSQTRSFSTLTDAQEHTPLAFALESASYHFVSKLLLEEQEALGSTES